MSSSLNRHSLILKTVAWLVILFFTTMEVGHAVSMAPAPVLIPNKAKHPVTEIIQDPSRLNIPLEHVALKEIYQGTNGKLIIHLQDAHTNYSGQQNLAKAWGYFLETYDDLSLVLTEGSAKDGTLSELRDLAPLQTWKRASKRFLWDSLIDGAEYLNLTTKHNMKILGIEYRDLYDKNVQSYVDLKNYRTRVLSYLHTIQVSLEKAKSKLYPRELLKYERTVILRDATNGSIPKNLPEELDSLLRLAHLTNISTDSFVEISRLLTISQMEQSLNFENPETAQSPEYKSYLAEFSNLKPHILLDELDMLENKLYDSLLTTETTQKLRAIDRYIALLKKAYQIQMSSSEFALLKASQPDFPTISWQAFLNQELETLGYYENLIPYTPLLDEAKPFLETFYALVDERDQAFLENTQYHISQTTANAAFLIAGGYHTKNLTRLLRQEGYSYVVLTQSKSPSKKPKVNSIRVNY